jgi:hypothetical protein
MRTCLTLAMLVLGLTPAWAHNTYTGRSGSPGRNTCATSCHGTTGGTISLSGFPASYTPNQSYPLSISHGAGGQIVNFNASCRTFGTGVDNAGTISAGTATAVYSVTGETNGVHFGASYQDAGTFTWTAPAAGTGPVRLYLGGIQFDMDGPNSILVLNATEEVPLAEPQTLVVLPSANHIQLAWTPVAGASGYNIYRGTSSDAIITLVGSSASASFVDSAAIDRADQRAFYSVTATRP